MSAPLGRCAGVWCVLALLGTAQAQPVTHPEPIPCAVTFTYAPDDVRAEIEAWVRAEPRCDRQLELRVVPTDGGLYVLARDTEGHVRERIVPSAEAAAVLVVSWIADDSVGPVPVMLAPPAPPALPRLGGDDMSLIRHVPRSERIGARRWLMLGGVAGDRGVGARMQLELLVRGRWSLGVAGAWLAAPDRRDSLMDAARQRGRAVVTIGRDIAAIGAVHLRAQLGAGVEVDHDDDMRDRGGETISPVGEAALLVTVPLGSSWGLVGGPVVDVTATDHPDASLGVFLGLGRRL